MADPKRLSGWQRTVIILLQRTILWLSQAWYLLALLTVTAILALALLAPALMAGGAAAAGRAAYRFLAPHDHQLPQRSYFLFGRVGGVRTYSLDQLLAWGADPNDLRAFIGNDKIGFKTGLNHRMLAIFVGLFGGGLVWRLAGDRPRLRLIPFIFFSLPLLLDGLSHMVSDAGDGFRMENRWAVVLTGNLFPASFYTGAAIGSLNWLLRTGTGLLFGLVLAWFLFTYLSDRFRAVRRALIPRLQRAGLL